MLPRILKGFNVYIDSENFIGRVESANLPDLKVKTEDHQGGGMDAPVELDMGMEKITVDLTFAERTPSIVKALGLMSANKQLVIRGALQRQGEPAVSMAVRLQGGISTLGGDELKQGSKGQFKVTVSCNSYIEEQDGEELVNIDILNFKRIIGGVDQLSAMKAML